MSGFIRNLRDDQVECIKKSLLFREKLLPDIKNGKIFPAIREDELHFYYKGIPLFVFRNKSFKYDPKYLDIQGEGKITEQTVASKLSCASYSFAENYEDLKDKCHEYNKNNKLNAEERELLSELYPCTFREDAPSSSVVVLDVEVFCGGKKCDMLLFDTKTGKLGLVEGKLFEDSRMYTKIAPAETIEVLAQLGAYDAMLKDGDNRRAIVEEYRKIIGILNGLFGTAYPLPEDLLDKTKLLVYRCKPLCEYAKSVNHHIPTRRAACEEINKRGMVLWCYGSDEPTLEQIWNECNGYDCR